MLKLFILCLTMLLSLNSTKILAATVPQNLRPDFPNTNVNEPPEITSTPFEICLNRADAEKTAACFRDEPICEKKLNQCVKTSQTQASTFPWDIVKIAGGVVLGMIIENNVR